MRLTSTFIINMGKNNAWQGPYNFSVHRPVTYWPPQRALRGFWEKQQISDMYAI